MLIFDAKTTVVVLITLPLLVAAVSLFKKRSDYVFNIFSLLIGALYILLLSSTPIDNTPIEIAPLLVFSLDKYSWLYVLLIGICWFITMIYSYDYTLYNFQEKSRKFHAYLGIVISALTASGLSGSLFTLFIFYVISIPLTYPLLTIRQTMDSKQVGKMYLLSTLLPSFVILLPAILIIVYYSGNYNFSSGAYANIRDNEGLSSLLLLMFIWGFSKNSVAPFHFWLPKTSHAPAPVSALIHSVAAVQTGSIALIKIGVYVFGMDYLYQLNSYFFQTGWLTYLCGFTALYTAYKAYQTDDIKKRFSYSTVGQLSYIITAILIGTKTSIMGAMLHILTHSFAKMSLFYVAGYYNSFYGTVKTYRIAKIAPRTRWLVFTIGISGLSIAGFPFMAGYYSKDYMLLEEIHTKHYAAAIFLLLGSVINILYILPIIKAGIFGKIDEDIKIHPIPPGMKLAIFLCVAIVISFSFYTYYLIRFLN